MRVRALSWRLGALLRENSKSLWAFNSSASENFEEEKQVAVSCPFFLVCCLRVYTVCQWLNLTEKLSPYWEIRLISVTDALQAVCWGDLSCKRNKSRTYIGLQIDFPGSRSFLLFMWCIKIGAGRQCSSQELPWTSFVKFPRLGCLFPPKESETNLPLKQLNKMEICVLWHENYETH